ncbi:MAG: hypothetical protein QOH47_2428 [Sphingomonadales bacterium]|jgi:hypothetical protein|nr:hypothetical protein [Sphingomonadales bacterium]
MPATADRIGFIRQQFREVVASDDAIKTRYGEDARDTGAEPVETFFDSIADAQIMCDQRFKLLKRDRRRFRTTVNSIVDFTGALDFSQVTPAATVIDSERGANLVGSIVEITQDHDKDRTSFVTWCVAENADMLSIALDLVTINAEYVEMI